MAMNPEADEVIQALRDLAGRQAARQEFYDTESFDELLAEARSMPAGLEREQAIRGLLVSKGLVLQGQDFGEGVILLVDVVVMTIRTLGTLSARLAALEGDDDDELGT